MQQFTTLTKCNFKKMLRKHFGHSTPNAKELSNPFMAHVGAFMHYYIFSKKAFEPPHAQLAGVQVFRTTRTYRAWLQCSSVPCR